MYASTAAAGTNHGMEVESESQVLCTGIEILYATGVAKVRYPCLNTISIVVRLSSIVKVQPVTYTNRYTHSQTEQYQRVICTSSSAFLNDGILNQKCACSFSIEFLLTHMILSERQSTSPGRSCSILSHIVYQSLSLQQYQCGVWLALASWPSSTFPRMPGTAEGEGEGERNEF